MWHDAVHALAVLAVDQPPTTNPSHDILVAVITVGGSIVLGLLTLLGTLIVTRRSGTPQSVPTPPPVPLNSDSLDDEEEDELRARIKVLERFLWLRRYDPNRIATGKEPVSDVQISE